MTIGYKTVSVCRLCDSSKVKQVLDFGLVPLANNLRIKEDLDKEEFRAPLRVFVCLDCGSCQLYDEVDPNLLFKEYNYASPNNLKGHFASYAFELSEKYLSPASIVVGIGGNNGLLEQEFIKRGVKSVINVDPAANITQSCDKNIIVINEFFNKETAQKIKGEYGQADLITANNVFAHIPNLNEVVEGIKILLNSYTGVFVFENAYLLNTLMNDDFGQFYSEHVYYQAVKPLVKFFKKHGLALFDVELNNVQMGSLRGKVCFEHSPVCEMSTSVANLTKLEENYGLYNLKAFDDFRKRIDDSSYKLRCDVGYSSSRVALYGVPAKIVLALQHWGLKKIEYAVDDSPIKVGKYIPGTKIEIKTSEFWKNDKPKNTIIGAYNFADDIKKKNPEYTGNWIVPFE